MKRLLIPLFFFLLATSTAFAQETTLTLPTNDNTSAFNVMKNNGTSVFKVDGNGMITGDGSELANVKSLTANASGDMQMEITSYDRYNPTLVRQVSITAPAQGVIIVIVSGYWQQKSENEDYTRSSIIPSTVPTNTHDFEEEYFGHLRISCDYGLTEIRDQYCSFSQQRAFTVPSAGTYTYYFYTDKVYQNCSVSVGDVEMTAVYIPTATLGVSGSQTALRAAILEDEVVIVPGSIDGHSSVSNKNIDQEISPFDRIKQLEEKIGKLEKIVTVQMEK